MNLLEMNIRERAYVVMGPYSLMGKRQEKEKECLIPQRVKTAH